MNFCNLCGQWHEPTSTACQRPAPPPDPAPALWEIAAQLRRIADALEAGKAPPLGATLTPTGWVMP
jgi:hypothetical protein